MQGLLNGWSKTADQSTGQKTRVLTTEAERRVSSKIKFFHLFILQKGKHEVYLSVLKYVTSVRVYTDV